MPIHVKTFETFEEIRAGLWELDLRTHEWAINRAWTVEFWQTARFGACQGSGAGASWLSRSGAVGSRRMWGLVRKARCWGMLSS